MIYTLKQKVFDSLIVFMLVMSTGGLLFVFNRNLSYLVFIFLLLITILFFGKGIKKSKINSAILTSFSIGSLFVINYIFAINEQKDSKYLYYLMIGLVSVLVLHHFSNIEIFKFY